MGGLRLITVLEDHHIEQLHQLYNTTWWTLTRSLEDVIFMLGHCQLLYALVDDENNLKGFTRVLTDFTYKAFIFDVMVNESHHGEGWGRFLMDTVMAEPQLSKVRHIELYCEEKMEPFYERWGFKKDLGLTFMRAMPHEES